MAVQHMNKKQYSEQQKKEQYEKFLQENPAVKEFYDGINNRFKMVRDFSQNGLVHKLIAKCDECNNEVTPTTFSVYMTPEKPHRCLLLCINCVERKAREHGIKL